jgi:hypothetical protein
MIGYRQYAFDAFVHGQLGKNDETSKDVMHRIRELL